MPLLVLLLLLLLLVDVCERDNISDRAIFHLGRVVEVERNDVVDDDVISRGEYPYIRLSICSQQPPTTNFDLIVSARVFEGVGFPLLLVDLKNFRVD